MNTKRHLFRIGAILALISCCCSCAGVTIADAQAERATYDWAEPIITAHITAEAEPVKAQDARALTSWRERLQAKFAAVGLKW